MKNNILIFGNGFIGKRLHEELKCACSNKTIGTLADIASEIQKYKPKIIINCIGHTGKRNVDDCELVPDQTLSANTFIPILMAEAALRNKIKLIHISSGCIYHFNYKKPKPITEDDIPDYHLLYYSRTKIYAENVLLELSKHYNILIVRIRIPLDDRPSPRNIINKLTKFDAVIDIPNSVTYVPDFVKALKHLIKVKAKGIYNVTCKEPLRYSQLLDVYKRYYPQFKYRTIPFNSLKTPRTNLILSTKKLEKSGFKQRPLNAILEECLKNYTKYS